VAAVRTVPCTTPTQDGEAFRHEVHADADCSWGQASIATRIWYAVGFLAKDSKEGGCPMLLTCLTDIIRDADPAVQSSLRLFLDQPSQYLMRRSCSLSYGGPEPLPILASANVKASDHGAVEPDTILIRETTNVIFSYDKSQLGETPKTRFPELIQQVIRGNVNLSIKCRVITSGSRTDREIGGRPSPVRAQAPVQ